MARSLNKVILIGYTADEPVVRAFDNGGKVANVTVVTNENVRHQDGNYEEIPEWNRIVFWNNLANIVETYVHKGMRLYVEGKLRTRSYTDKTGVKRYTTEIYADNMIMLDSRNADGGAPRPPMPDYSQGSMGTGSFYNQNNPGSFNRGVGSQPRFSNGGVQGSTNPPSYPGATNTYGGVQSNPYNTPNNFGGNPGGPYGNPTPYQSPANTFQGQNGAYKNTTWGSPAPAAPAAPVTPATTPGSFEPQAAPAAPTYPQFDNSPYGGLGGSATATPAPGSFGSATAGTYGNTSFASDSAPAVSDGGAATSPAPAATAAPTAPATPAAPEAPAVTPTAAPVNDNSNDDDIPF